MAVSTINNAVAPPGGCRQRSTNIAPMAAPTANAAASAGGPTQCTQATPTSAETAWPPTTAQGCAIGLAGAPNTSTALAPIGATSQGQAALAAVPPARVAQPAGDQDAQNGTDRHAHLLAPVGRHGRGPERTQPGDETDAGGLNCGLARRGG